jgi:TrmH family RNA methyltransferase
VLYETTDAVNIGGVLRAMANTGFARLRLVNPAPYDTWDLIGVAHYTQHILEAAPNLPDLTSALDDMHLVVGLTGKHHRDQRNARRFADTLQLVADAAAGGESVALLFGREDTGLPNAALDRCHFITTIPTNPAHPSLNLAQAVLLTLYPLFQRAEGDQQTLRPARRSAPPATSALMDDLFADLERGLDAIEFLNMRPRESTLRSLRAILYRARLDQREASLLRAAAIEIRRFLHRRGVLPEVGPIGRGNLADD